jgi:hypothetical protein
LNTTIKELKQLVCAVSCQPMKKGFSEYLREEIERLELNLIRQYYNLRKRDDLITKLKIINQQYGLSLDYSYFANRWDKFYGHLGNNKFDDSKKSLVINRDRKQCMYCGFTRRLEVHHVIPQVMHGSNSEFNLVCTCKICNRSIGDSIKIPRNWWKLHPESHNNPFVKYRKSEKLL